MNRPPLLSWLAIVSVMVFVLTACGGGGGGGDNGGDVSTSTDGDAPVTLTAVVLSGQVMAPTGSFASSSQTDRLLTQILDSLVATAHAELSGLTSVLDGTNVELVRIDSSGTVIETIATTTIEGGQYQFDLTALGVTFSSDLLVRVYDPATGIEMRAFVTSESVDIDPLSETVLRIVLDTIASTQNVDLDNFTLAEIEALAGSLNLLTSDGNMQSSADFESTILTVRNLVTDNADLASFLNTIVQPGQSKTGPGDLGNYFPFIQGASWTYTVSGTEDGVTFAPYTNTVTVNGTRVIDGVTTTVFSESNPDGDNVPEDSFYQKTSKGIFDWTPVNDGMLMMPFSSMLFPAAPGTSFQQQLGDLGLNGDIDRDGIIEEFRFTATISIVKLETVGVPAGDLPDSLKTSMVATASTTISSTGETMDITVTGFEWYTKNLGLSKQVLTYKATYGNETWTDTKTQELTEANGFPFTGDFPLDRSTSLDIETNDIVYDPVSGKLFASVPSDAANYADNIVVVDPINAQVEAAIPVGSNPGPLAVSDDGQFLYVGLNGSPASILQISIPTLTAGPEWILSDNLGARYPHYIDVQPGNPEVLAVTTTSSPNIFVHGPNFRGAIILDNGTERPISIPWNLDEAPWQRFGPIAIEFSDDPTVAYGYNWYLNSNDLLVLSINPDGITISETKPDFYDYWSGDFKYDNGHLFTNRGYVYDPINGLIGNYPSDYDGYRQIEPDSARNRVAMTRPGIILEVFAMDSYTKQSELRIPATTYEWSVDLEGCGDPGYAIRLLNTDNFSDAPNTRLVLTKFAPHN